MRLWLHLNLRRPQPFFTAALRNSGAPWLPHSRAPALENSRALEFRRESDRFLRWRVLKWALEPVCNIFWHFIHNYALFFVKSWPASDS